MYVPSFSNEVSLVASGVPVGADSLNVGFAGQRLKDGSSGALGLEAGWLVSE